MNYKEIIGKAREWCNRKISDQHEETNGYKYRANNLMAFLETLSPESLKEVSVGRARDE